MPYVIKMRNTKGYVTGFYKNKDKEMKVSYHKHLSKAKIWKTEKGVKKALYKFIFKNKDEKIDEREFKILKKPNYELGISNYDKKEINNLNKNLNTNKENDYENKDELKDYNFIMKKYIIIKRKIRLIIKYIIDKKKYYLPE